MRSLSYVSAILSVLLASLSFKSTGVSKTESAPGIDSAWVDLFDGRSLKGWHSYNAKEPGRLWSADSGTIHLLPGAKKGYQTEGGGDLVTDAEYSDFVLETEWKVSRTANSGIILYVKESPEFKETWYTGFEVQVCDNEFNVDAHVPKRDPGAIYDLVPVKAEASKSFGEWNKVRLVSRNGKVDIWLNGQHNISFDRNGEAWKRAIAASKFRSMPGFGMYKTGRIALQDHGQEIWYRNLRLLPL